MSATRDLIGRMASLGCHLMPLASQLKRPASEGWPLAVALTADDAVAHVERGGNIGVNLALSRLVVLDAENFAATAAVQSAGFSHTVIPAKAQAPYAKDPAQDKRGGSHTWLRVPEGIDAMTLPTNGARRIAVALPGGGKIDVLAGARYVVAPPSRIDEAPEYMYAPCQGGVLDADSGVEDIPVAPMWLFDRSVPAPEGLEPLSGSLIPDPPREKVEQDARSIELTSQIDAVPWNQWLAGDARLTPLGELDGCGCEIYHWQGASNDKSATLHDSCEQGSGAHIWSGTMVAQLGLHGDHFSRLDLAVALRGETRREVAASVGVAIGSDREELRALRPNDFEALARAADAAGETRQAAVFREAAEVMDQLMPTSTQRGETFVSSPVIGAPAPAPPQPHGPTPQPPMDGANALAADDAPSADLPATDSRPDRGGVASVVGKLTIRSFPGRQLGEIPVPAEDELNEYPLPKTPAHVRPVDGPKTEMLPVLPPLANRLGHENVDQEWIFAATPGLSHVAAAADSRGVSRWGLLGALLPRVASTIPATVRLTPASRAVPSDPGPTAAGTSINIFAVLVGPPASGKTDTMSAAAALIPGAITVPPGTGEGVLKVFPRGGENPSTSNDSTTGGDTGPTVGSVGSVNERSTESVLVESDEIDVFVGEMMRQGSKTTGLYRSMWMGGQVGNTTSDRDRHSFVDAHTYRFGILLGAQPDAVSSLFSEAGRGTPQRFMWMAAHQTTPRGPEYPQRLATAPVYWFDGRPSMIPQMGGQRPPVWITPPPAAVDFMDTERARAATANPYSPGGRYDTHDIVASTAEMISNRHAVLQQLKISVLLAALDGLAQPQDTHWFAAGAVMAVRRRTIEYLVTVAEQISIDDKRKRGREQGIMQAHAKAASERETRDRREEVAAQVLVEIAAITRERGTITRSELCARVSQAGLGTADFVPDALATLTARGVLAQTGDVNTYVLTTTGNHVQGATVSVLRPLATEVPTISDVGRR